MPNKDMTQAIWDFASRLSVEVGGGAAEKSKVQPREFTFKNEHGYDCGVTQNAASQTAHVFIYSLTPKTLYLPDLDDSNFERALKFIKSDGADKAPWTPGTSEELERIPMNRDVKDIKSARVRSKRVRAEGDWRDCEKCGRTVIGNPDADLTPYTDDYVHFGQVCPSCYDDLVQMADRRLDRENKMKGSKIKASASYAEVKEALEAFLSRHPEVSHDASIARGNGADSILSGAIASMAFEGTGSLFDTMNYGTGDGAKDQAVIADLTKTLRDIGCYYEQGHDWSLGVYPIEEDAEDLATRTAVNNLADALSVQDPDDLTVDSTTQTSDGPVISISHGNKTYLVGDSDALDAMALEQIEQQIESDRKSIDSGKEPSYFSVETYESYADRDAVREWAESSSQSMFEDEANRLSTEDKLEWLDEHDGEWRTKAGVVEGEDPTDDQVEKAFGYGEEWVEAQVSAAVNDTNAAFSMLEEMGMSAVQQGLIDWDHMAKDVLQSDGAAAFLGGELYEDSTITYVAL